MIIGAGVKSEKCVCFTASSGAILLLKADVLLMVFGFNSAESV
jgi:hypothetical protein